ncbi:MAG: redoxin domain-containing protein [Solirubrobacteraceae bacterium]
MRPPVDHIQAPEFPARLPWLNVDKPLWMHEQRGHPVLVEFWDFCRPNSIHTLPYVRGWHERYGSGGLRVVGVHSSGFPPSADPDAVAGAVARLGVLHPVLVDLELRTWREYDNLGWPARYLFGPDGRLRDFHYGEGGYVETELAIQELLSVEREPIEPLRPEDEPGVLLAAQSEDVPGAYCGPYEAGAVWAVLDGHGTVVANKRSLQVDDPGCYELVTHPVSTAGELALSVSDGLTCHAVCFTPGLAP